MTLTAGAITGAAGTETFDNLDNLIQGTGTISNLLLLDNSGTIEATGGLLTLNTGHQIDNDGTGVLEASSGATLEIDDSLNNDGQLNTNGGTIDFKGGAIVNNNAVNGIAIDHTFKVDVATLSLSGGGLVTLTAGAITGAAGTETFDNLDNLIQGTGTISNLLLLDNSGTIEATGGLLTLNTGHQIDNDGTGVLEASSGATLEIDDSLNNDGQLNTNGGTIDFKGGAIVNNNAVNGIAIDHTFKVDVATLSLSGGGLVTLTAGAITGAAGTETFDNLDNLIQGTGTISNLLLLDNSGTIEATGGLLTLNTGHQIDNDGTGVLEASSGATLEIDDSLNNDGQLNTNGGTIDFKGGAIVNNNAVNGIAIDHTFKVDVATLSLSGGGLVTLTAGAITGAAGTETFDNLDNLIQGTGTISNLLLLDNSGTIEATGGLLTLNTGHQIDNDGTGVLEASSGATLEIDDSLNNDGQLNTNGGTIDFKGGAIVNNNAVNGIAIDHTFKVDVATLSLSGGGLVTLTAGAITGAAGTETFDNLDNLIQGTGTISNLLLLDNSGTIEATGGLLTLNTGHQIDNDGTGVLEASSGATLEIDDSLNNDGQLNTNGGTIDFKGGAIVNNNAVNGIAIDHTFKVDVATLSLSGGGLVTLTAGAITGAAGTETFDNLDNLIQGTGTISNLLLLDNSGTIEATGGLLTLNTGHQIDNDGTGVLEASSGATLEIDDSLNNDGQLNTNGGTIDFKGGAIVNNNAVNGIAIDHTFKVDVATLSLSGGGLVTLTAGAITGAAGTETFDNLDNLIQGTGTISNLLLLDNSGTIEATGGLLTLNTGHQIDNDGTGVLEASSGATLEIDDSLNNDGQLNTNGGTIDFKGGAIVNNNAVNGIAIDHTFKVDVATLSLSGGGLVTLTAGAITGAAGTETFDNLDNLIQGTGTISNLRCSTTAARSRLPAGC